MLFWVPYARSKPMEKIYPRSEIIDYIREHNPDGQRVFDSEGEGSYEKGCPLGPGSPMASVYGVPSIQGYNPLDVARYRQFLAIVVGHRQSLTAFSNDFTHPVIRGFQIYDKDLIDLLGVRYLVQSPRFRYGSEVREVCAVDEGHSFNFLGKGIQWIRQLSLLENNRVMPRTFVVREAVLMESEATGFERLQAQLHAIDVRHTATLEDWDPATTPLPQSSSPPGPAKIQSHKPNEIRIALDGHTAGLLVLTDPWYPGWVCRVDGNEVPIWKADYAFRGVMVPEGSREVVFHFEPQSYRRGKWISLVTLAFVICFFAVSLRPLRNRKKSSGFA
jgi:Bacterial membrane protein YfhO